MEKLTARVEVIRVAEEADAARVANVLLLGALAGSGLVPMGIGSFEEAISEIVPPQAVELNLRAFRKGLEAVQ